jgi:predicted TIM-barrel fold metal-dependent hydrolase
MIVDFQHHYTPRELFAARGEGGSLSARLDKDGNPSYLLNPQLCDLDAHIRMMDHAGIDIAVLSCGEGFDNPDIDGCRFINDKMKEAEERYPGRFIGLAHVPALDADTGPAEIRRCAKEHGFPGIVIASELQGQALDTPALDPIWKTVSDLGLYVFVHPLPRVIAWDKMHADDLGRVIGWEFSLLVATLRMMNAGVLDRFPDLKVQFAHMSGGIGRYMGRIRGFAERDQWGTSAYPRHNRRPEKPYDHYIAERLMYDCAGWVGPVATARQGVEWIDYSLKEAPVSQIVFATDYPQAIRTDADCKEYVEAVRAMGQTGATILSGNARKLIPSLPHAKAQ